MRRIHGLASALALALVASVGASSGSAAEAGGSLPWLASWSTAHHVQGASLTEQSVRVIVHLTQGGNALRVKLGNALGAGQFTVGAATAALRAQGSSVVGSTVRPLTFEGNTTAVIPAGGFLWSDPVELKTSANADVAVSLYVPGTQTPSTHTEGLDTSYLTPAGARDHTKDQPGDSYSATTTEFPIVAAVDVRGTPALGAVVVVGGSVTDGTGSRKTGPLGTGPQAPPNSRWSDVLARRLQGLPQQRQLSVVEAGIGGNTSSPACPNGASTPPNPNSNIEQRFDRDVLSQSGVRVVVVYAGTNDLGYATGCAAGSIIASFRRLAERSHAAGVSIIFATVTPRIIYTPLQNAERRLVNAWVLKGSDCGGECDGVVDFDAVIRSPYPDAIDPRFDSGDTIHPNADGYALMGKAFDLSLFQR